MGSNEPRRPKTAAMTVMGFRIAASIKEFAVRRLLVLAFLNVCAALPAQAAATRLLEPALHIAKGGAGHPQVALTLDACMGRTDTRILEALVQNRIAATIFVTERWLKSNKPALAVMLAHPDLFELEDHGAMHIPAVTTQPTVYRIRTAGTLAAVNAEVDGGEKALLAATGRHAGWYRDATALYSADALAQIRQMGYRVAGFSLNGDAGASLLAPVVAQRIGAAKDGDVIISHITQPSHSAGAGVVEGILALKAKGFRFVRLDEVAETDKDVALKRPLMN